jgi:hypothetical protein
MRERGDGVDFKVIGGDDVGVLVPGLDSTRY